VVTVESPLIIVDAAVVISKSPLRPATLPPEANFKSPPVSVFPVSPAAIETYVARQS